MVAVACTEKKTLERRIEDSGSVQSSYILVWNFADPIHPQYVLEAPGELSTFKINPNNPEIVVGGMMSGQVVYWELSTTESQNDDFSEMTSAFGSTNNEESKQHSQVVKHSVVSSIDWSHKMEISDLHWLPSNMVVDSNGVLIKDKQDNVHLDAETKDRDNRRRFRNIKDHKLPPQKEKPMNQFATVSVDGDMMFWDIRFDKETKKLDHTWQPIHIMPLFKLDGSGMKLRGLRCSIGNLAPDSEKSSRFLASSEDGEVIYLEIAHRLRESSTQEKKQDTPAFVFNIDGEDNDDSNGGESSESNADAYDQGSATVIITNTASPQQKDPSARTIQRLESSGKGKSENHLKGLNVKNVLEIHTGPTVVLAQSPFFDDIFLTGGEWNFGVWKWGVFEELLRSPNGTSRVTSATWSPSRPGVFFIGRSDGGVEMWDLLDRSHEPSIRQSLFPSAVTSMQFQKVPVHHRRGHEQYLLALGDEAGVLHIMEVPRNLQRRVHHEIQLMQQQFDREEMRIEYTQKRLQIRQDEMALANIRAAKQRINQEDGDSQMSEAELLQEQQLEDEYRSMEAQFRKQYGMQGLHSSGSTASLALDNNGDNMTTSATSSSSSSSSTFDFDDEDFSETDDDDLSDDEEEFE
eukprot:TRINITY_DN440_c1_g1_i1.p1 TRINITY_DN440_c1_g1~~TRINITY_DN440_c1_g1_i1.p1  ORF type:complete len:633 (-),score=221.70 TRINITY_DN440_c1_g1_i1:15-1913(-)